MNTISIPTTQHIELEYPVAGIGDRILSGVIDVVLVILYHVLWYYLLQEYVFAGGFEDFFSGDLQVLSLFALLPANFYSFICEAFFNGRTLGKWIMNTRSISLQGRSPSLSEYFLRWLLRALDIWFAASILMPGLVGLITIGISKRGQRLGDLAAGTTVIKLKLVTTFVDTIYTETGENHKMHFPEINRLSDRDMSILKEVLDAGLKSNNPELLDKLAKRVMQVAEIETDMAPKQFLETVLQDYNHYYGK